MNVHMDSDLTQETSTSASSGSLVGIQYEFRAANHSQSHTYLFPIVANILSDVSSGARVMDIGCGNGSFISLFRDRGWKLYGTDFSSAGIQIATKHFPEIIFVLADATRTPMPEVFQEQQGCFDAIISTEMIEHLYAPRGMLRNAYTLLKPGGKLVVSTPYHGYLKNLFLAIAGKFDKHFNSNRDHGHIKFWSRRTFLALLSECGFTQCKFYGAGRVSWLWKSMVFSATKPLHLRA